jgi:hypothetical protein
MIWGIICLWDRSVKASIGPIIGWLVKVGARVVYHARK